jgi:hypothetical protein
VISGQELLLENAGSEATFELRVQLGSNKQASAVRSSVTIEVGQAAHIRPGNWAENAIAHEESTTESQIIYHPVFTNPQSNKFRKMPDYPCCSQLREHSC